MVTEAGHRRFDSTLHSQKSLSGTAARLEIVPGILDFHLRLYLMRVFLHGTYLCESSNITRRMV